jgi:hypothetical protein
LGWLRRSRFLWEVDRQSRTANVYHSDPARPATDIPPVRPPWPSGATQGNEAKHGLRSLKLQACLSALESTVFKRQLLESETSKVAVSCAALLASAFGDERIVIRLVKLEWAQSQADPVEALQRAISRWQTDHNRFG